MYFGISHNFKYYILYYWWNVLEQLFHVPSIDEFYFSVRSLHSIKQKWYALLHTLKTARWRIKNTLQIIMACNIAFNYEYRISNDLLQKSGDLHVFHNCSKLLTFRRELSTNEALPWKTEYDYFNKQLKCWIDISVHKFI